MGSYGGEVIYYNAMDDDASHSLQEAGRNLAATQARFEEFLRTYYKNAEGQQDYGDALLRDGKQLKVDYSDVMDFNSELAHLLREDPTTFLPVLEAAAANVLASFYYSDAEEAQGDFRGVQVLLHSSSRMDGPSSLRALSSDHISKLVMLPGIITAASPPKHKATHFTLQCKDCKTTKVVTVKPGIAGTTIPRRCDAGGQQDPSFTATCSLDPFQVLTSKSEFVDTQRLKMQERPEDTPTGELPRNMQLIVDRNLVGHIAPGTRVTVYGIYSVYQSKQRKGDQGGVALRMPYLRVVGLNEEVEGAHSAPVFTVEEEQRFRDFAADPDVHANVFGRMAPNIFGHDDIKKALACLLFGGARKKMSDGTFRRGDINVLLIGDPSTAKSQFLKFASKTAPIAVYTSGKGSSAAGLTASVIRQPGGEFHLEAGAMVLADNGVVCIDEFDKMRSEDRVAIHEAMEQQTISVAKAGITTMLKSRTSVLAAANPPSGRYDDLKSAHENIDLQTTILSRFDLIFIVKDLRSKERDTQIAEHILRVHTAGARNEPEGEEIEEERFLKRYLEYARTKCFPRLTEQAMRILADEYIELRTKARQAASGAKSGMPAVPITVRQLEAVVRVAESLARMQLLVEASEAHVREALALFTVSTMDAVNSGSVEFTPTEEQRKELHSVETEVKRRVPVGASANVRKLTSELVRTGLSEMLVTRALLVLGQTDEMQLLQNNRVVRRLK